LLRVFSIAEPGIHFCGKYASVTGDILMSKNTYAIAGLLGAALLTSAAFAQAPATTSRDANASSTSINQNHQGEWRASKLVGVNVYNDNNEKLGSIDDLVVDKSGAIKTAIIGVGGFLGVGERYIAVKFDSLKWSNEPVRTASTTSDGTRTVGSSSSANANDNNWYPDHGRLNLSKDEVGKLPEFKY
jgi:sporulation protein YlmC with PRC-barrel domain